jgi:hypothetical protein
MRSQYRSPAPVEPLAARALWRLSHWLTVLETPGDDPWRPRELPLATWRARRKLARLLERLEDGAR